MESRPSSPLFRWSFQTSSYGDQQKSDSEETYYEFEQVEKDDEKSTMKTYAEEPSVIFTEENNFDSGKKNLLIPGDSSSVIPPQNPQQFCNKDDTLFPINQLSQCDLLKDAVADTCTVETNDFGDSQWLMSIVNPGRIDSVEKLPQAAENPSDSQLCLPADLDNTQWQAGHVDQLVTQCQPQHSADSFETQFSPVRKSETAISATPDITLGANDEKINFPVGHLYAKRDYHEVDMIISNRDTSCRNNESMVADCPETKYNFPGDNVPVLADLNFNIANELEVKYDLYRDVEELMDVCLDDLDVESLKEEISSFFPSPYKRNEDCHESNLNSTAAVQTNQRIMNAALPKRPRGKPALKKVKKASKKTQHACHAMILRSKQIQQTDSKPVNDSTVFREKDTQDLEEEVLVSWKKRPSASRSVRRNLLDESEEARTPVRDGSQRNRAKKTPIKSLKTDRVATRVVTCLDKKTPLRRCCDLNQRDGSSPCKPMFPGNDCGTKDKIPRYAMELRCKKLSTEKAFHKEKPNSQGGPSRKELAEIEDQLRELRKKVNDAIFDDSSTISNETARNIREIILERQQQLDKWNHIVVGHKVTNRLKNMMLICETMDYQLGALMENANDCTAYSNPTPPPISTIDAAEQRELDSIVTSIGGLGIDGDSSNDVVLESSNSVLEKEIQQKTQLCSEIKKRKKSPYRIKQPKLFKVDNRVQESSRLNPETIDTHETGLLWTSQHISSEQEAARNADVIQVNAVLSNPALPCEKCFRNSKFQPMSKVLTMDRATNTDFEDVTYPKPTTTKVDCGTNTDLQNTTVERKLIDCAVNTDFDESVCYRGTSIRKSCESDEESLPDLDLKNVTGVWLPHPSEYIIEPEAVRAFWERGCTGEMPPEMLADFEWDGPNTVYFSTKDL